jgi:hypothetical protein
MTVMSQKFFNSKVIKIVPKRCPPLILILAFICGTVHAQITDSLFPAVKNAGNNFSTRKFISIAAPTLMITYGAISLKSRTLLNVDSNIKTWLHEKRYTTQSPVSDYLQFSPAVATFGMKIAGVKSAHNLRDMTIMYILSNLVETGVIHTVKKASARMRPDGSSRNSFPSGHTATAFVAAEFLHQEYKDRSLWISISGYTVATATGVLRMLNNRHWFSDVITGAGVGILSVKAVYWAYPSLQKMWRKKDSQDPKSFIFPSFDNGVFCLGFSHKF